MSTYSELRVGDRVRIDIGDENSKWAGVWTVVKKLPKNLMLEDMSGRRARVHPSFLSPAPNGNGPLKRTPAKKSIPAYVPPQRWFAGQVVLKRGESRKYVVLSHNAKSVSIAPLNGNGGRYVRCPATWLTLSNAV